MRYLGIDFGRARIGIALSDPDGRIAFPKDTFENGDRINLQKKLQKLITDEDVSYVVVGLPLDRDGKETEESAEVRKFSAWLRTVVALPIEFENEIFTSRMATHAGVKKANIDAASAAIILQSYLDKIKK